MTAKQKKPLRPQSAQKPGVRKVKSTRTSDQHQLRLLPRARSETTAARVARTLRDIVGRNVSIEALYGRQTGGPPQQEFLARVPITAPEESTPRYAFDLAHRVRDQSQGELVWVEPDVIQRPRVTFPDVELVRDGEPADRAEVGEAVSDLCMEKATPPSDRYWHLREMKVQQAWDFSIASGAPARGLGIRIGHLDTGWTTHPELEPSLDLRGQFDFVDDDPIARDEQAKGNPFHGSRTGSVIASTFSGDLPGKAAPFLGDLAGVSPNAKPVPIRVVKRVVVFFNGDVARGIRHAADNDCHVISMSLGGVGGNTLHDAVRHAVAKNLIVCAAAGNCVGMVVWPARFPESIAVAATNSNNPLEGQLSW